MEPQKLDSPQQAVTKKRKSILILLSVVTILLAAAGGFYWHYKSRTDAPPVASEKPMGADLDTSRIPVFTEEGWGFADQEGNLLIAPQFSDADFFHNGLARVQTQDMKTGYINTSGEMVIEARYTQGTHFAFGRAFVVEEGGCPVCINTQGEKVFELPEAEEAYQFAEGLARFAILDTVKESPHGASRVMHYGYVDLHGKQAISPAFSDAGDFRNGRGRVKNSQGLYGFIDLHGKMVIPCEYTEASDFSENCATVTIGGDNPHTAVIDLEGNILHEGTFEKVMPYHEGMAAVQLPNKQWGYADKNGQTVIKPQNLVSAGEFHNGTAVIKRNRSWETMTSAGEIFPLKQVNKVSEFFNHIAIAHTDTLCGFINAAGEWVVNGKFLQAKSPAGQECSRVENEFYDASEFLAEFSEHLTATSLEGMEYPLLFSSLSNCTFINEMKIHGRLAYASLNTPFAENITLKYFTCNFPSSIQNYSDGQYTTNHGLPAESVEWSFALTHLAQIRITSIAMALIRQIEKNFNIEMSRDMNYNGTCYTGYRGDWEITIKTTYEGILVTVFFGEQPLAIEEPMEYFDVA